MPAIAVSEFDQIVTAYERQLYSYARRVVGNAEDAEEVVQDAFVRAHRALVRMQQRERDELRLRPWLYVITLNAARNRLRKKRVISVSLDAIEDPERFFPQVPEDASPESIYEELVNRRLIESALLEVPERLRPAAKLRFIDGLTHVEIAKQFDKPVGTIKSHVHRAVVVMRRVLREELHAA
jgi:RNA polymerase sigma-70 factor, ECF subfamily